MKKIISLIFASILFFSCSSDKVKSSANYIEKFSLPDEIPVQINIINEQNLVNILTDSANYDMLSAVEPIVVPSKDARIAKEGENWTSPDFKYVITAENGDIRKYSVVISKTVPNKNSFEDWTLDKGYYVLSDLNWTSGNAGISTALQMLVRDKTDPQNYPTKQTTEGYEGNAVILETIEGGTVFRREIPLFSGNFFLGNFNTNKMASDELAATEFGKLYFAKPKSIKGYYKYQEGAGDFKTNNPSKIGSKDSCDIYAGFYQASDDNGNEIILTAKDKDNLKESDYVLAFDRWSNCSGTDGEFKEFALSFETYKREPDFKTYSYKLLITFAASKDGATTYDGKIAYEGKIGSKLIVDEVEIENY